MDVQTTLIDTYPNHLGVRSSWSNPDIFTGGESVYSFSGLDGKKYKYNGLTWMVFFKCIGVGCM